MRALCFYLFLMIILLLNSCALHDIYLLFQKNEEIDPKWDLDVDVKIIKKEISLKDYIKPISIPSFSVTVPNLLQWPISVGETEFPLISDDIDISGVNKYDFDNDGVDDYLVKGVRSRNASITLTVWLTTSSDPATILPFTSNSGIDLIHATIEGRSYTFINPTIDAQGRLVYLPQNFLDPTVDYYLNFEGDPLNNADQINVPEVRVHLIPTSGAPDFPQILPDSYTLHVQVDFDLGNFDVVGEVVNNSTIDVSDLATINLSNIISMSGLKINELGFKYQIRNVTPFYVVTQGSITASNLTPVPDSFLINILSGNLVKHPNFNTYNNYWYVTSGKDVSGKFTIKNPNQYENLEMGLTFEIQQDPGRYVMFAISQASVVFELIIQGEVTVDY